MTDLFADLPEQRARGGPSSPWRPPDWPFGTLRPKSYRRIIADPPWRFTLHSEATGAGKSPQAHYDCMALEDIQALPVAQLAHPCGCLLLLWTTWAMVPAGLATLKAWGFRYVTGAPWIKRTLTGKVAFGTGYVLRVSTEPFLIGTIGRPAWAPERASVRGLIDAAVREHSRKPDEQYALIERLVQGPGAELFARQAWPGWDAWGNQAGKFTADPAPP